MEMSPINGGNGPFGALIIHTNKGITPRPTGLRVFHQAALMDLTERLKKLTHGGLLSFEGYVTYE
jgi:hypothetical protein